MLWKLLKNDLRHQLLQTFNIAFFIFLSVTFLATAGQLAIHLTDSVQHLTRTAKMPHILQMHTGTIDRERMQDFVDQHQAISDMQILNFLNIDNASISVNGQSLKDSVYDNGFSTQSPRFDYLLDLEGKLIQAKKGQVYAPIFYLTSGKIKLGDRVTIGQHSFQVAGFVRDSQMNSSLSVSRRFIISQEDYDALAPLGRLEYLIEFRLHDLAKSSEIETAYSQAGLEADGPPLITYALFQITNAFSDGLTILALMVISFLIILIALLCIRLTLLAKLEEDYRELAILKAIGIPLADIRKIFLSKYLLVAGLASLLGFLASFLVKQPLLANMKLFFGQAPETIWTAVLALLASGFIFLMIYISMHRLSKQLKTLSLNPALVQEKELASPHLSSLPRSLKLALSDIWARKKIYATMLIVLVLSLFVVVLPMSIYSTISDKSFTHYLGLGDYHVRVDLSQFSGKEKQVEDLLADLKKDQTIAKMSVYRSYMLNYLTESGRKQKLWVDTGNQQDFSVKYIEGHAPSSQKEIALSKLKADDVKKKVGDKMTLIIDGKEETVTVSGIYSDLTNGGKTAKATFRPQKEEVIWLIIPLQLRSEKASKDLIKSYQAKYSFAKFSDIKSYREQIFGSTIQMVAAISWWAFAGSIFLIFLITTLFMRMLFVKDRGQTALFKALGFSNRDIQSQYLLTSSLILLLGLLLGNLLAVSLGSQVGSSLLALFGIAGVRFIQNPVFSLVLAPLALLVSSLLATKVAISDLAVMNINISNLLKEDS